MTKEEIENGTADMEIDQRELMNGDRSELNAVPDGFNANYLKVYYGKLHIYFFDLFSLIIASVLYKSS